MAKSITVVDVLPLVDKYNGNVAAIARALGVNRATVWARCQESVTLMAALESARESMLDNAESVLYKKVLEGSTAELLFFLKTRGKGRGYSERMEHTGADGQPIDIRRVAELSDEELDALAERLGLSGSG